MKQLLFFGKQIFIVLIGMTCGELYIFLTINQKGELAILRSRYGIKFSLYKSSFKNLNILLREEKEAFRFYRKLDNKELNKIINDFTQK